MSELMEQFLEMSVSSHLIPSLPDDVTIDIVAHVPISHYPTLTLVSKSFRKLIASPKLYERRSFLGCKEHRVYAVLRNHNRNTRDFSFYILHRKVNCNNRLVVVKSIPLMYSGGSYATVGSKVYVFNDLDALSIDCTSHTHQPISDIPQRMAYKVVHVVDEKKIYVIGDSVCGAGSFTFEMWKKAVTVFDTETQLWEPKLVKEDMSTGVLWSDSVVMDGKIYLKSYSKRHSFVYGPEERKWEVMDEVMDSKSWEGACVVDNVLYYYDWYGTALRAYDPKQGSWSVVNGLEDFLAVETTKYTKWPMAVKCGEKKLALFFSNIDDRSKVIFCAEIALERRQGGEIWGKMESCDVVVEDGLIDLVKCVSVTV